MGRLMCVVPRKETEWFWCMVTRFKVMSPHPSSFSPGLLSHYSFTADSSLLLLFNYRTGWSINNRTILNCSHFIARQYFFTSFSPKWSIHTGKLPQQHEFANASFVILIRCHFVSPYHVDGSANNVPCRAGHFCEIAGVPAHLVSSQVQLEQENSLNSLKRYPKTAWPEWPRHFERKE